MAKKNKVSSKQFNGLSSQGVNGFKRASPMGLNGISDEEYIDAAASKTLRKKRLRYLKSINGYNM